MISTNEKKKTLKEEKKNLYLFLTVRPQGIVLSRAAPNRSAFVTLPISSGPRHNQKKFELGEEYRTGEENRMQESHILFHNHYVTSGNLSGETSAYLAREDALVHIFSFRKSRPHTLQ